MVSRLAEMEFEVLGTILTWKRSKIKIDFVTVGQSLT